MEKWLNEFKSQVRGSECKLEAPGAKLEAVGAKLEALEAKFEALRTKFKNQVPGSGSQV